MRHVPPAALFYRAALARRESIRLCHEYGELRRQIYANFARADALCDAYGEAFEHTEMRIQRRRLRDGDWPPSMTN